MAGRGRGEMDPSACHINILLASDLIIIKQPIYTVRHVMLVNCTKKKKKKNPTACNIKPSNLMPTPLGESLKFSSFCLPSLFFLSWMCLCHKSPASGFPFFPSTSKRHNLYLSGVNGSQSKGGGGRPATKARQTWTHFGLIPRSSDTDALSRPLIQLHTTPFSLWMRRSRLNVPPMQYQMI